MAHYRSMDMEASHYTRSSGGQMNDSCPICTSLLSSLSHLENIDFYCESCKDSYRLSKFAFTRSKQNNEITHLIIVLSQYVIYNFYNENRTKIYSINEKSQDEKMVISFPLIRFESDSIDCIEKKINLLMMMK